MASKEVVLKYPIPYKTEGGEQTEKKILTFGRLKTKHLKLLPDSFFESGGKNMSPKVVIPIVAGICNIPIESAEEIDVLEDLAKVVEVMSGFLGSSLATGKK